MVVIWGALVVVRVALPEKKFYFDFNKICLDTFAITILLDLICWEKISSDKLVNYAGLYIKSKARRTLWRGFLARVWWCRTQPIRCHKFPPVQEAAEKWKFLSRFIAVISFFAS